MPWNWNTVETHSAWMLKTELGSSRRTAGALNHGATSLAPTPVILMIRHDEAMIPSLEALVHSTLTLWHAETDRSWLCGH